MRTALLFLVFIGLALSYHFWRVTCIQDEQIVLLREKVSLSSQKASLHRDVAWMMAEGTRMCAEDLIETPRWLGLIRSNKKPEIVAVRNRKIKGGIGGGP